MVSNTGRKSTQLYEEMLAAQLSKDPELIKKAEEARKAFDAEFRRTQFRRDEEEEFKILEERVATLESWVGMK